MITPFYADYLLWLWTEFHEHERWVTFLDFHDAEDLEYFAMLNEQSPSLVREREKPPALGPAVLVDSSQAQKAT